MYKKNNLVLVSTGGTIEMESDEKGINFSRSINSSEDPFFAAGLPSGSKLSHIKLFCLPSPHIGISEIQLLVNKLRQLEKSGIYSGVVVTHGTDTLEESAFLADLCLSGKIPVVFTASMRSRAELGVDGPRNVRDAFLVVVSNIPEELGVTVVLNDEIHAAARVTKTYTSNLSSFASPGYGPLGVVDEDRVIINRIPARKLKLRDKDLNLYPDVDIVKMAVGFGLNQIRNSTDRGCKGLIIEAFGRGNTSPEVAEAIEKAVDQGMIVLITTRCYMGRVLDVYSYPGGGIDLKQRGAILAGDLPGHKLRLFLMAAIGMGYTKDEVEKLLDSL